MKFTLVTLIAAALNARGSQAKLTGTNQEPVKVCECNEASGLCGSVNKASDDTYFHVDTLQTKKYDFFLEEGTDSGCCENGCEANCGQTQRGLAPNPRAENAKNIAQYCGDNPGECNPNADGYTVSPADDPLQDCEALSEVKMTNCVCNTGGDTYECGVPGSKLSSVTFDVTGFDGPCTAGDHCHCQRSAGCRMICSGRAGADKVDVGACYEDSYYYGSAAVDEADEAVSLFDGGTRALKEESGTKVKVTGARRNRALCVNQECCASLIGGPPSCVPEGTCKVIHEYHLAKNGGGE